MVQRDDDARVARRGCVKIRFAELQTTRAREQLALIFFYATVRPFLLRSTSRVHYSTVVLTRKGRADRRLIVVGALPVPHVHTYSLRAQFLCFSHCCVCMRLVYSRTFTDVVVVSGFLRPGSS